MNPAKSDDLRERRRFPASFFSKKIVARFLTAIIGLLMLAIIIPLPQSFFNPSDATSLRITDRQGILLYESLKQGAARTYLQYDDIPTQIIEVLVAAEDRTFFSHPGVSVRGIARAIRENVKAGKTVAGGSTLTQQLARAILKPSQRTYAYKALEIAVALKIDMQLKKERILELYLNTVSFGHQAYGINAAEKTYFGKSPFELSYAETVFLIGLLKSPTGYDPYRFFPAALKRQKVLLRSFYESGIISEQTMKEALQEHISLPEDRVAIQAPHFSLWVAGKVKSGVQEIRTTLDAHLQSEVELIVKNALESLSEKNVSSASVVVLDVQSGDILAFVGSGDYFDEANDGAVNVALSPRQPGSAVKPFTYALALENGDTAATTVADVESQFFTQDGNPYTPRNYDFGYHGLVRYREALANSYNIAAVKVLERVGVDRLLAFLREVGITTLTEDPDHYGLALTLGDAEVTLLELTQAYGIFPRLGRTLKARATLDEKQYESKQVLDPSVAWLMTDMLSDNEARIPEFGEASPLAFQYPVAAKTGTTRNSRDNWTLGFTADRIVGVWVGNADNSPMKGTSGITGAAPIFHDVMDAAMRNLPKTLKPRPATIVEREICRTSGLLSTPECNERMTEYFIRGTEPTTHDTMHKNIRIDSRNGLLASDSCEAQYVIEKPFIDFPPDVKKWALENGYPLIPHSLSPLCTGERLKQGHEMTWLRIQKPHERDSFLLDPTIPNSNEKIIFEATASEGISSIDWRVNGRVVGKGTGPTFHFMWDPIIGTHTLEAVAGSVRDARTITVVQ